jgi:hypothetical protein
MRRRSARLLTIGLLVLLLIGAAALALVRPERPFDVSPRAGKPPLMLLTTLPLMFPEDFSLEEGGSMALSALETRYRVVPIGTTDSLSLRGGRLVFMAHALAQPPGSLVELDEWVRQGGRLLLLADPKLDWPSNLPLGDKLRPPPSFADTGLLAHWGLKLIKSEIAGPISTKIGPDRFVFSSVGELQNAGSNCALEAKGIIARCRIGRGRVTVIADADWLDIEQMRGIEQGQNTELLLRELARLER